MTSGGMRTLTVAITAGLSAALLWLPLPGIWWHVIRSAFYLPIYLTGARYGPFAGLIGGVAASLLCAFGASSSGIFDPGWSSVFSPDLAVVGLLGGFASGLPRFRELHSEGRIEAWPAPSRIAEREINFDLNPLASIEDAVGLLAEADTPDAQRQELVGIILTECRRLSGSIKDMLQRCPEPSQEHQAEVTAILDAAVQEAQFVLGGQGISVRKEATLGMPPIQCNPDQIRNLLKSLAVKAAGYGLAGNEVVLNARCRDDGVFLEVKNQGQRSLVRWASNRFFGSNPLTTGASLNYDIVRQHGGTIRSHSTIGKGLEFSVWLPLRRNNIYGSWQGAGRRG
jgi:hypothetical protein